MMKLIGWMLVVLPGLLFAGEMEVRRYAIDTQSWKEAYWRTVNDIDPFDEGGIPPEVGDDWLGVEVAEAGFESRFLREGMSSRDCSKWLEVSKIEGKAVYDVEGEFLILMADEKAHEGIESWVLWSIPGSVRTEISIYEVSGVTLKDRSGFWEEVPVGAKLLGDLSCLAIPGQAYEARSRDGGIDLVGELQFDGGDGFIENRMTLKVNLAEGEFSWKTGFSIPGGLMWAQEVGSLDGKAGLMAVVRQDRVTLDGRLLDEAILKEEGGAFLREERLEKMRWKDPAEKPERDLTKPFQEYEIPPSFELFLIDEGTGGKVILANQYPEVNGVGGRFYDCRVLLERNGISFRQGDFTLLQAGSSTMYVKLSDINLELLEGIVESGHGDFFLRMIRLEFAQVEGEDFRKGKILQKVGLTLVPGQVGTASLGEDLTVELESQIDGNDELIEFRATLSEDGEGGNESGFKTGGTLRNGRAVAIQKGFSNGVWKTWVVTGRVLALELEIDQFLKAQGR